MRLTNRPTPGAGQEPLLRRHSSCHGESSTSSSYPLSSSRSALHTGSANALLNVADFSAGEGYLHVLVVVDCLCSQLSDSCWLPEGTGYLVHGLPKSDGRRRSIGRGRGGG